MGIQNSSWTTTSGKVINFYDFNAKDGIDLLYKINEAYPSLSISEFKELCMGIMFRLDCPK